MTRAVTLAEIADTNTFIVDGTNVRVGINSSIPTTTLDVGGAVKATSFTGDGSSLTGVASTDNIITGTAATFTSNVNISGITTVGVLTAYTSVTVGAAITADAASGIVTATTFSGALTGNVTGNASGSSGSCSGNSATATVATNAQGLTGTPDIAVRNITGVAATFTGVLTYEDVTNIDSIGIVTARTGVRVNAGGIIVTAGISTIGAGVSVTGPYKENITAMGALEVDCSTGNYFTKTIAGNSTFTFANVPTGCAYAFTLELTHSSGTVTWPASVKFPADTAPTLTTGKTHLFMFITDDGGTRFRGSSLVDYVN
jgi:hypothetical protein